MTAALASISERDFTDQILDLAKLLGWTRAHFRPAMTKHGWRTPVQGDGVGFPDLILVRPPRLIAAELKTKVGKLRPEQTAWLDLLRACPGVEVHVWRPADFDDITATLRLAARTVAP
jgi:hypothetical protein